MNLTVLLRISKERFCIKIYNRLETFFFLSRKCIPNNEFGNVLSAESNYLNFIFHLFYLIMYDLFCLRITNSDKILCLFSDLVILLLHFTI